MKEGLGEEHFRRLKKFLKSKLNCVNMLSAINSRAVAVIRYSAGVIKWTKEELQNLQSRPKVAGTLELDHVSPIPQINVGKYRVFSNEKVKKSSDYQHLRELVCFLNLFVRDCRSKAFDNIPGIPLQGRQGQPVFKQKKWRTRTYKCRELC